MIQEGKAVLQGVLPKVISRKLPVFYNPIMSHNRDIAVSLINAWGKSIQAADPLAASGIRTIRFLKECKNVRFVAANDANKNAVIAIKKNLRSNKIPQSRFSLHNQEASIFLLASSGFDYIDIDPFGSPNPFLDAAVKRLARDGILAVTATDTAALAGASPRACMRKYWATPLKNESLHEMGLRILIRKIQLISAQYDKALIPVFSYAEHHYMRVYLHNKKAKTAVDEVLQKHNTLGYCQHCCKTSIIHTEKETCECKNKYTTAGPVWTGQLWDPSLIKKMKSECKHCSALIQTLLKEASVQTLGIIDLNTLASQLKLSLPKQQDMIDTITSKGYTSTPTHFSRNSLRTNAPPTVLKNILHTLSRTAH